MQVLLPNTPSSFTIDSISMFQNKQAQENGLDRLAEVINQNISIANPESCEGDGMSLNPASIKHQPLLHYMKPQQMHQFPLIKSVSK